MTKEQLAELKARPVWSVYKYRMMLTEGKITQQQYDWVIHQISTPTAPDSQEQAHGQAASGTTTEPIKDIPLRSEVGGSRRGSDETSQAATNHTDKVAGKTQRERILNLLLDGNWHTNNEIMDKCYELAEREKRNCRYSSRIDELRKQGHNITDAEYVSKGVYRFRLIKPVSPFYGG